MTNKICSLLVFLLAGLSIHAQEYFVRGKDTTYARNMEYTTNSQGFITEIKYTDRSGKQVTLDGKKNLKNVQSLHYNNGVVERMPLKISKPDAYVRYGGRVVDGKLKVLLYDDQEETLTWVRNPWDQRMSKFQNTTSGTRLFYLRLPDGTLYDLSKKKEVKNNVMPYLMKCDEFRKQYKDDLSMKQNDIVKMIRLYNDVCR
jgi:hypothetical protein